MSSEANQVSFPCQSCGGQMMFDTESQNLKCGYCAREETIENIMTEPQEHSLNFADVEEAASTDWDTEQQALSCSNCGGQMLLSNHQTAVTCPFADRQKYCLKMMRKEVYVLNRFYPFGSHKSKPFPHSVHGNENVGLHLTNLRNRMLIQV